MKLRFKEAMWGKTEDGRRFGFALTAEAPTLGAVALSERLSIEGEASLEGAAEASPLSGTLRIGLPWRRVLEYDFSFRGADGATYRYSGQKRVRLLRFLRTMTTLVGTLYRDGEALGGATATFALRDLPALVRSVRLVA